MCRQKRFLKRNSKCKFSEQQDRGRWRIYRPHRLFLGLWFYLSELGNNENVLSRVMA